MGKQNFLLIWNPTEKEVDCNILFVVIYARKSKKRRRKKRSTIIYTALVLRYYNGNFSMLVNGKGDITVCYTLLISQPEQILTDL